MNYNNNYKEAYFIPRGEKLFIQLCEEIDDLREQVAYWKSKYEQESKEFSQFVDDRLKDSQIGVKNMLMFAMSVQDNEDGSLSISKENRELLADQLRNEPENLNK